MSQAKHAVKHELFFLYNKKTTWNNILLINSNPQGRIEATQAFRYNVLLGTGKETMYKKKYGYSIITFHKDLNVSY